MAPKRSKPLEDPPPASSSEEDEETDSGEEEGEEGSSSEEEETELTPKPPQIQTSKPAGKKPDSNPQKSDSESDSESDSDSEDEGKATVKPIASKPMEETPSKTIKSRSKPPSVTSASATKSTAAAKRGGETDRDPKDSKRSKKESESDGAVEKSEDTKKLLFQRLWSEADEIAVLEGIIEYAEKKGIDPTKDMISFYDFIKKSLHFDVSLSQLKDKVSRLKKKFENHVSKGKKGEDKTFSKPHDQKSFDLSKRIWGSGAGGEPSIKSNGKAVSNNNTNSKGKSLAALKAELGVGVDHAEKEAEKVDKKETQSVTKQISEFDKGVSVSGMEDYVLRKGMDMLDGAKKVEMEEKWRKLHVAELELFLKRNELIREQAKLMLAAFKSE